MSEPQPSNAEEVDAEPSSVALPANASAEDRKAAAALSSLDAPTDDSAALPKSQADQKALGEAINRLEGGGAGSSSKGTEAKKKEEVKKKVKVETGDVTLLVCGRCLGMVIASKANSDRSSIWSLARQRLQSFSAVMTGSLIEH
jgi:hypothetical protein